MSGYANAVIITYENNQLFPLTAFSKGSNFLYENNFPFIRNKKIKTHFCLKVCYSDHENSELKNWASLSWKTCVVFLLWIKIHLVSLLF